MLIDLVKPTDNTIMTKAVCLRDGDRLGDEPERRSFNEWIAAAATTWISATSLLETRMVLFVRSGENTILALDAFLLQSGMAVEEVSPRIADIACDAYRRFGKGTGHGAALN